MANARCKLKLCITSTTIRCCVFCYSAPRQRPTLPSNYAMHWLVVHLFQVLNVPPLPATSSA